jgi:hypothetical protein
MQETKQIWQRGSRSPGRIIPGLFFREVLHEDKGIGELLQVNRGTVIQL